MTDITPGRILTGERGAAYRLLGPLAGALHRTESVRSSGAESSKPLVTKILAVPPNVMASDTLRTALERHVDSIAAVASPHVAPVRDRGVIDGRPFVVMDHLEGADSARVRPTDPTPILLQAAAGLAAIHRAGTIHGDVRPSHLLAASVTGGVRACWVGFGFARPTFNVFTRSQNVTIVAPSLPTWASPEELAGHERDLHSDLWGLSATAFWLLTGRFAFDGDSPLGVAERVFRGQRELAGARYDAVFDRAFSMDRRLRFQDALSLGRALAAGAS